MVTVIYADDTWNIGDGNWRLGIWKMGVRKMVVTDDAMRCHDQILLNFMGLCIGRLQHMSARGAGCDGLGGIRQWLQIVSMG